MAQQCRDDEADAFAAARGRKRYDVLGAIMPKIMARKVPRRTPSAANNPRLIDFMMGGPPCGTIGCDELRLTSRQTEPRTAEKAARNPLLAAISPPRVKMSGAYDS
jgi:hypothetical protein